LTASLSGQPADKHAESERDEDGHERLLLEVVVGLTHGLLRLPGCLLIVAVGLCLSVTQNLAGG
jgi:hypothetical protein